MFQSPAAQLIARGTGEDPSVYEKERKSDRKFAIGMLEAMGVTLVVGGAAVICIKIPGCRKLFVAPPGSLAQQRQAGAAAEAEELGALPRPRTARSAPLRYQPGFLQELEVASRPQLAAPAARRSLLG